MKIAKEDLQRIINECVDAKLGPREDEDGSGLMENMTDPQPSQTVAPIEEMSGDQPLDMRSVGIRWDNMQVLNGQGKLKGKWVVIMKAYQEAKGDEEVALRLLKAAAATLEPNIVKKKPEEMASQAELTDFSKF